MCLATAYWSAKNDQPILRDIALMEVKGEDVHLQSLFGEQEVVRGRVTEVDFEESKIILERQPAAEDSNG